MPQMSPLMWTILFLFFSMILMMTSVKSYFNSSVKIKDTTNSTLQINKTNQNWLW